MASTSVLQYFISDLHQYENHLQWTKLRSLVGSSYCNNATEQNDEKGLWRENIVKFENAIIINPTPNGTNVEKMFAGNIPVK